MMKKLLFTFLGILIGVFIGMLVGVIIDLAYIYPTKEWEKLDNVPVSAAFVGGCDGGCWMELVEIRNDTVRFKIYQDWSGVLIYDADFVYEDSYDFYLTKTNWTQYVSDFNFSGDKKICCNYLGCLMPVIPEYYKNLSYFWY